MLTTYTDEQLINLQGIALNKEDYTTAEDIERELERRAGY